MYFISMPVSIIRLLNNFIIVKANRGEIIFELLFLTLWLYFLTRYSSKVSSNVHTYHKNKIFLWAHQIPSFLNLELRSHKFLSCNWVCLFLSTVYVNNNIQFLGKNEVSQLFVTSKTTNTNFHELCNQSDYFGQKDSIFVSK